MREALYMIDAEEVYVVPDFISEGYFTKEVIPRELELTGPTTKIHGKTVHYCDPVGIHPSMTSLILQQGSPSFCSSFSYVTRSRRSHTSRGMVALCNTTPSNLH